ncbi:GGDEF domain-containing protein [Oceanotoga teriensis]|uniref:GGDEF domain-containing protein n=1 Tax=Oceanotoga teriensis TaxID=515440 RepID=UPI002712400C|nr:GGDEF domain-containing protein [Oceanotoga teriensis]MDO7976771.1 GGDEF domain-containing protein [Oceanotoga teriensis]
MNNDYKLENKIFYIILIISIVLSIFSMIGNILFKFPLNVNIKWIGFILISLITYIKKNDEERKIGKILYFSFLIFFMIPYGWFNSGGAANNTMGYAFLLLIAITYLVYGKTRIFFITSLIAMLTILHIISYYYPSLVAIYDLKSQFYDRLIQIPLTFIGTYLLVKKFSDAYRNEKEKLEKTNNKLKFYANKDTITGLYNRRFLDQKLKLIINNADCEKKEIYSIIYDIDNFKKINDNYGHDYGDLIIKEIGNITKNIFKEDSFNARWGGDEFYTVYFGEKEKLIKKLEMLKKEVQEKTNIKNIKITISIGYTRIKNVDTIESLLKRIDKALYTSKKAGKNQYTYL